MHQFNKILLFLLPGIFGYQAVCAQTAPSITFTNNVPTFTVGSSITTIYPTNTGGAPYALGQTITFAGSGVANYTNGTGTAAAFNQPLDLTTDASGNVYVADEGNQIIRKISPTGVVTTLAGLGVAGYVNGTGSSAEFNHPAAVSLDGAGNVYVGDQYNNMIRLVTIGGTASSFSGNGTQGFINSTATAAEFNYPIGTAVDASGNVYVADYNNHVIRKITSSGSVTTFAGNGSASFVNGTGTSASFNHPIGVAVDASGNVYVADRYNHAIRKITSSGVVTTLAGSGSAGFANGTGTAASFYYPTSVAVDASGNVFVADEYNQQIRKITPQGVVTTLAGSTTSGSTDGTGTAASFYNPYGVSVDPLGNIYVADEGNNKIRKIMTGGYSISPALPTGLVFDPTTGGISGTPAGVSVATAYNVTAYNSYGSSTTTITITINAAGSFNPSQNQNYIVTYSPRVSGITNNSALTAASSNKSQVEIGVQYMDGLGRPVQTVQVKGSPAGNDVVEPIVYDLYGREITKYLPYANNPSLTSDGSYKTDALTQQANFYNASAAWASNVVTTPYPVSGINYEPSLLNRTIEQGAPGLSWQLSTSGVSGGGHTVKMAYGTNAATDVILWVANSGGGGATGTSNYAASALFSTTTTDENGHSSIEYKDRLGRVVCKKVESAANPLTYIATYYVYNDDGNLVYVIPPMPGTYPTSFTETTPVFINYIYGYHYDTRNRIVQKKIPGKGWQFIVYNTLDQVVMTQDANQRNQTPQAWTFIKYDSKGREIITGLWNYPSSAADNNIASPSQTEFQWLVNFYATTTNPKWESPNGTTTSGYDGQSDPEGQTYTFLTLNYYDTYSNIPNLPTTYNAPADASTFTSGLLTVSERNILGTNNMLFAVTYYDGLGRMIKSYNQHYLGGTINNNNYDAVTNTYDFANAVTTTTRQHFTSANISTPLVTISNKYIYDHMGRKLKTWEQLQNSGLAADKNTLVSQLDYNEVGQPMIRHLHSTDSLNFLQNVAYSYNERGWLLQSNAPLFEEQLQYNIVNKVTGISPAAQFNGNVASQSWGTSAAPNTGSFVYSYDAMDRLNYGRSVDNNFIERSLVYDNLGNITKLSRVCNGILIDSLIYSYGGTNQITSISDKSTDPGPLGYKAGTWTYAYDNNGNMITDNSKGIGITYNMLNLPNTIAAVNTSYIYDSNGKKLRRLIGANTTEYIDGIQYDNGTLTFIQTDEGRALPNGTTAYNYEYTLSDHLGNSRLTFDSATGVARTEQQDNYMPFGFDISIGTIGSPQNYYLYNKKELQQNLQLYDYGDRLYDPVTARWGHIDQKAELYFSITPYAYAANDPVNAIDPNGRLVIFVNGNYLDGSGGTREYWQTKDVTTQDIIYGSDGQSWITYNTTPGQDFAQAVMDKLGDHHDLYINGAGNYIKGYHPIIALLSPWLTGIGAADRYDGGYREGKSEAAAVINSLHKTHGVIDESIKVIAHSMGAAYAKGYIKAIIDYARLHHIKIKIAFEADFAPYQTGQQKAVAGVRTFQYSHDESLAGDDPVDGEIQMDTSEDEEQIHDIISFLDDISNLPVGNYKVVKGKIVPVPGS